MKKCFLGKMIVLLLISLFFVFPLNAKADPDDTIIYYPLNYYLNGGVNNANNPLQYSENEPTINLNNPTKKGYAFGGWYLDSSFQNLVTSIPEGSTGEMNLYALWYKSSYKIKYNANKGKGKMSDTTCKANTNCALRNKTFKRTGYSFIEWNTLANGNGTSYSNKQVVKNITTGSSITLYAIWKPIVYHIKLSGNGSPTESMEIIDCTYGQSCQLPVNTYTRVGYTFAGWNSKSNGKGKNYKNNQIIKNLTSSAKTVTLYAKWNKIKYSIKYNLNGGKNNKKNPGSYYVTTATINFKNPSRSGYAFLGWYTDSEFTNRVTSIPKGSTGNVVLYAKWIKSEYKVSFNANSGSGKMKTITCKINKNCNLTKNGFSKKGYSFVEWNTLADGSGISYKNKSAMNISVATDTKLYAIWKINNYSINYKLNGGINNVDNPSTYTYLDSVSLQKPTREGYNFGGWFSDSKLKKKVTSIAKGSTGNKTLYAKWNKIIFKVNKTDFSIDYKNYAEVEITLAKKGKISYKIDDTKVVTGLLGARTGDKQYLYLFSKGTGNTKVTLTNSVDSTKLVLNVNVTAPWSNPITNNLHKVKFDLSDGDKLFLGDYYEMSEKEYTYSFENGETYGFISAKNKMPYGTKEGYLFNGWYTEKNGQGTRIKADTIVNLDKDISLYPYWVKKGDANVLKEEDYIKPTIIIKNNSITVTTRNQLDEAIRNNIDYFDDRDLNPVMDYNINYDNAYGHYFEVEVTVIDYNDNKTFSYFTVEVAGEKRMSDGSWITYDEFKLLKNRSREICTEHGFFDNDYYCYSVEELNYYFEISYNGAVSVDIYENGRCYYDENLDVSWCSDGLNDVSYNIMPNGYKESSPAILALIKSYFDDVKTQTGYNVSELSW